MAYEYAVDTERRLVRVRMWGDVTTAELLRLVQELGGDPRITPDFAELIDLAAASVKTITARHLRDLAASALDPVARRAFVTADALAFGLARMFESLRAANQAPEENAVFMDLAQAEAWLGLT